MSQLARQDNSPLQKEPAQIHINNVKLALEPQPYSILTLMLVSQLVQMDKQLPLKVQVQTLLSSVKLALEPPYLILILHHVFLLVLQVNYLRQKEPVQIPINNVELAQEQMPY